MLDSKGFTELIPGPPGFEAYADAMSRLLPLPLNRKGWKRCLHPSTAPVVAERGS